MASAIEKMRKGEKLDLVMLKIWKEGRFGSHYDFVRSFLNNISDEEFDKIMDIKE